MPPPHLNRANDTLVLNNDQNEILKKTVLSRAYLYKIGLNPNPNIVQRQNMTLKYVFIVTMKNGNNERKYSMNMHKSDRRKLSNVFAHLRGQLFKFFVHGDYF